MLVLSSQIIYHQKSQTTFKSKIFPGIQGDNNPCARKKKKKGIK